MKLHVTLAALVLAALSGCAAPAEDETGSQEAAIGAEPTAAGIVEGSTEEEGVLLLANERAADAETLATAGVPRAVANGMVAFRTDQGGAPRWFETLDEVDALPGTDGAAFTALVTAARARGLVEPEAVEPSRSRLLVPDDLGRPPRETDVTVEAGVDGKTPAEVLAIVRSRARNRIHTRNEAMFTRLLEGTLRSFTVGVNNLFVAQAPSARLVASLNAQKVYLMGTLSAVTPTFIQVEFDGVRLAYGRGDTGEYEPIERPRAPVVMRARIETGKGARVFYPSWKAPVLATPPTPALPPGG